MTFGKRKQKGAWGIVPEPSCRPEVGGWELSQAPQRRMSLCLGLTAPSDPLFSFGAASR